MFLCMAGVATAQEAKLTTANTAHPALQGYFGVPGLGQFVRGEIVWHRSGRIISMESMSPGISPVSLWQADAKTMRANRVSLLDVGDAWCISQKGDLLCARSRRMADQPDLDPAKNSQAWTAGAFGCFRIQDGTRLWKLPMRDGESISGAIYTTDDKKVALLSTWNQQMSLRLLDASSGAVLQQYDFPGRSKPLSFYASRLMIRGSELWMPHRENGKQVLLRFSLTTLQPTPVDCPPLEHLAGVAQLSPDARRIVSRTEFGLTCLEFRNGKWDVAFEDSNFRSTPNSEFGTLRSVEFTPDGQRLVIVTTEFARVLDLATKKVHQIKLDQNSGGTLSPNGSHLLVEHENGLAIVSLRETDATHGGSREKSAWRPHMLRFTGDGKTLLSVDLEGIWVWDVASRKPRAWLRSFDSHVLDESTFQHLSLIANDTEVVSEEHDDPIRWKLPSAATPPPDKLQIIAPELAFGGVRQGWNGPYPGVFVNQDASWILSTNAKKQGVIRSAFGAGSARSITGQFPSVYPQLWFFAPNDTFVLHAAITGKWQRVNLRQGTIEDLPGTPGIPDPEKPGRFVHPQPVGVLPKRQFIVREMRGRFCVTSLDGQTQLPWFEATFPGDAIPNLHPGVSLDEKRCACVLRDFVRGQQNVFVWEIETGKLLGYAPLPTNDVTCLALSPEGSLLACGHASTAISLWEVAKLTVPASPAPPPPPTQPAAPAKSVTAPMPATSPQGATVSQPSTKRREHLFGSGVWDFLDNGTVSKGEVLPEGGRLRINGKEFEMKGHRLTHPGDLSRLFHAQQDFQSETLPNRANPRFYPLPQSKYAQVAAGLIHLSEGSVDDVWISRQAGNPVDRWHQFLTFTDTLTNLSAQDKQVEIEFEVRFPAQTKQLVDSSLQPVETNAEGIVQTKPDAVWLAALPAPGASRDIPVFWFRSLSGPHTCQLKWKPETHSLVVRHSALLPPGDPRYLAHGMRIVSLPEGLAPDHFQAPMLTDFGNQVIFSVGPRGINFGVPEMENMGLVKLEGASRLNDEMGHIWIKNADGSLQNSNGIASAHQLWLDGAPLAGSSMGVFAYREDRALLHQPSNILAFYGSSLDEKVTVTRSPGHSADQQMPIIIDYITNQQKEPRAAKVAYVSSFSEPIKALYNGKGLPVIPSTTPQSARELGGALIIEFDGPKRPATLLAFYQEGAAAEPKVSWPGPKLLKLEYEVTLPPQQSAEFWHGATQRPVAGFDSVMAAFSGCLPFKRAPTYKGNGVFMNVQ
jgi:WD40 repeat protein